MTNNSLFKETKLVNTYINYFITVYYIYENVGNGIVNNNAENFKEVNACIFQHTTPEENVHDTVQKRLRRRPRKWGTRATSDVPNNFTFQSETFLCTVTFTAFYVRRTILCFKSSCSVHVHLEVCEEMNKLWPFLSLESWMLHTLLLINTT